MHVSLHASIPFCCMYASLFVHFMSLPSLHHSIHFKFLEEDKSASHRQCYMSKNLIAAVLKNSKPFCLLRLMRVSVPSLHRDLVIPELIYCTLRAQITHNYFTHLTGFAVDINISGNKSFHSKHISLVSSCIESFFIL